MAANDTSWNEGAPRCPSCGWADSRRSMPHGFLDRLIRLLGLVPFRCRTCGERFYRLGRETDHETAG